MDTQKKLVVWLKQMDYDGKIPKDMSPFCNSSTAFIWEQLIAKVKPKEEVEYIRNNILIKRLLKDDQMCSSPTVSEIKKHSHYPLKEVEVWNRKQKLKKQVDAAQDRILELNKKLNRLSTSNKKKYVGLENMRQKIKETHEFIFLLDAKSKQLERDAEAAQEMLAHVQNLTPVESEEQNRGDVLENLKKCSGKLEEIIQKEDETTVKQDAMNESLGLLSDFSITFDDVPIASSSKNQNFKANPCQDWAKMNEQQLNYLVEEILHKNDRLVVWNMLMELCRDDKLQLLESSIDNNTRDSEIASSSDTKDNKETLTDLYATHVNYELKIAKVGMKIRTLQQEVNEVQNNALIKLSSHSNALQLQNYIHLQQKHAGLSAMVQYLQMLLNTMRESLRAHTDITTNQNKSLAIKEAITSKSLSIERKLKVFKHIYGSMSQDRSEIFLLTRKLSQFTTDINWYLPLSANSNSIEIGTFFEFPLEYNRTINDGNNKRFLHELPLNCIPYQEDFTSNLVYMLVTLLQNPCSPAESLLFEILKVRIKMEQLKIMHCIPEGFKQYKYTLQELERQESFIKYALDKLKFMIYRNSNCPDILASIKSIVNLWLEMPIKKFVSPHRLFNRSPYSHYDKLFDTLYKQL